MKAYTRSPDKVWHEITSQQHFNENITNNERWTTTTTITTTVPYLYIGIKHVFHALTFARSRGSCWKPRPSASVFNTSQGTWHMLMHWKTMFNRYYCVKTEHICYISRYFLHYFVSLFHRCRANAIATYYSCSRAGQYTSRDGSNSVVPVRAYWTLRNRALTARELPC